MELVTYKIPARKGGNEPVVIHPIGDIQWTGEKGSTAIDALRREIDRTLALNGYFIGMGDYIDFMSPSNRQRKRAAALYDTAEDVIDDKAMDLVHELYDVALRPTKGRWLGMVEGHHFSELKTGDTTDQRLCQLLDARFLGTSALIRFQFQIWCRHGNIVLWVHHGTGSGQKACAPLNKLENLAPYWGGVDVFLMAHTTKSPVVPINRVYPRWHGNGAPDLIHKKVYFVSTGGYSKAYSQGHMQGRVPRGDYAEQRMLNPSVIGAPLIFIHPMLEYLGKQKSKTGTRVQNWAPVVKVEV